MSKIEPLTDINASYTGITKLNAHLDKIEAAFQNTVSRDGSSPNEMLANLDMNSNQLLNLAAPTVASNAATKAYVDAAVDDVLAAVEGSDGTTLSFALSRANHTGTQTISTIDGLQTILDGKAETASLSNYLQVSAAVSGYQPLAAVLTNTTASFTIADETKLDGIEALADVTDAANVNAAGALMHTDFGSSGLMSRTGSETYASRTLTGTSAEITVTNGDGVSGNPTISIPSSVTLTGKTLTGGTFSGPTLSGTVGGTPTFSGVVTSSTGFSSSSTAPYFDLRETDASANETRWRLQSIAGDFYVVAYSDDFATNTTPVLITRSGTTIDRITLTGTEVRFNGTTLDINAAMDVSGALTNGSNYTLTNWTSADTDIDGLITGSTFGMLLEGAASGHTVLGIRENDGGDTFSVISGYDGVNFYTTDNLYKRLCFQVSAIGNAYVNGTLDLGHATANTLSASGGVLSIEGVAIPTISSTSTLTNKTLSGGTISGTVAGAPTLSGIWTFSSSPVVPTPSAATDAANKAYVDSVATGLQVKDSVATATTANITLSGEQTIDGVLTSASRVLVKNQTTTADNGIYVSAAGAWSRATDMNTWAETVGALVPVSGGTTNGNKVFASSTASGGTLGVTTVSFAEFINTSGLQPLDSDLTAIAALATTSFGRGLLTEASASSTRTTLGLVIGTDVQAYSSVLASTTASFTTADETKLDNIEASADVTDTTNVDAAGAVMHTDLATNGMLVRTGSEAYTARTITQPAAGISVTNGDGVAGNPTIALTNDLSALEALSGTGIAIRTATDTWVQRAVTGTTNEITVTNGDGVSGAPTISLPSTVVMTGKQLNNGTYLNPTLSGTVAGTPTFSGNVVFSGTPQFSGNTSILGTLDLGHASDTTLSRKSSGIAQIETRQLATIGPKSYRASQYLTLDGSTDDYSALNSLHSTVSSAGGVLIIDGLARLSTSITLTVPVIVESGGFTIDSGDVLTINGEFIAGRFQVFQGSGTVTWGSVNPDLYPEWWGVKSNPVSGASSSANLTAVNAMHASVAASSYGAIIRWSNKPYTFSGAWTAITKNNIRHIGAGGASLGTWFIFENLTGDDITFSSSQHCGVEHISFIYYAKKTSGWSIKFDSMSWSYIRNCTTYYGYNGFNIHDSSECVAEDVQFRNLAGTRGLLFSGSFVDDGAGNNTKGSYRVSIRNLMGATAAPIGSINDITKVKGNWATSTVYSLEDVVIANSKIWMCTTAGTSSGSGTGPNALPGSTAPEQWTTAVTDGTAAWKFMWNADLTWLCQDSYAYSLALDGAALVNGAWGFQMTDSANTGTSYPIWAFLRGIETDHTHYAGINLAGGEGAFISNGWQGSSLTSHGIRSVSGFRGEVTITGNRIYANAASGIFVAAPGFIITGNQIGDNSVASSGTYNGVTVSAGISDFLITNNRIGDLVGVAGNRQGYGVAIGVGASDNYIVTQNIMRGNVTGGLSDGGTGVNKTVTGNIV